MRHTFIFLIITFFGLSFDRLNVFKYCILSSILHEAGHIAAYKLFTGKMPEIEVSVFGFRMKNDVLYNDKFLIILLAGPLANLILSAASLIIIQKQFKLDLYVFMTVNAVLFLYNIVPVFYLDGGQIMYIISPFYRRYYKQISWFFTALTAVMLIYFTDNIIRLFIFIIYFIINISNDI